MLGGRRCGRTRPVPSDARSRRCVCFPFCLPLQWPWPPSAPSSLARLHSPCEEMHTGKGSASAGKKRATSPLTPPPLTRLVRLLPLPPPPFALCSDDDRVTWSAAPSRTRTSRRAAAAPRRLPLLTRSRASSSCSADREQVRRTEGQRASDRILGVTAAAEPCMHSRCTLPHCCVHLVRQGHAVRQFGERVWIRPPVGRRSAAR